VFDISGTLHKGLFKGLTSLAKVVQRRDLGNPVDGRGPRIGGMSAVIRFKRTSWALSFHAAMNKI
jgi:hypothetical protein